MNRSRDGAQTFTRYLRRGTGDRYPRSALAAMAQRRGLALAEALEERFGQIRCLAHSVSRVRMVVRQDAKLERAMGEGAEDRWKQRAIGAMAR